MGQCVWRNRQRRAPGAAQSLRTAAPVRAAAGRPGCADQHARQHHHPRDPGRGAGLGGDWRSSLARDRRGLLAFGCHRARLFRHWRPDMRRDLDAAARAGRAIGRQEPGALHRLQHDAAGRSAAALDWRPGLCRLLGAQPVNGILAQQNATTGMITYFLPLEAGAAKKWGTPTDDFWCCHGSLVQAHTLHNSAVYFEDAAGLLVAQYIPSELAWERAGVPIRITQKLDPHRDRTRRPGANVMQISVTCAEPIEFTLKLRLPRWVAGAPKILVNGVPVAVEAGAQQ